MQVTDNDRKVWKEAVSRCLSSQEDYEKYSKDVISYFFDEEPESIDLLLKKLEPPLRSKRYGVVNKLSSLLLLRDCSEKKSKKFAEALAQNRALYVSVYQIAIAEPFIKSPLLEKRTLPGFEKKNSDSKTKESNGNKCIRLAIECILFWRLNFGALPDPTGRLFCGLYAKALQSEVVFPEMFTFFKEDSQKAIKQLAKTMKENPEESFADISITEESFLVTMKSEDDLDTKRTQSSLEFDRRSSIDRKCSLAQLEAELVGLRQLKIEEGKTYMQEGLIEKPSELRDQFSVFLTEMKQKIGPMMAKAAVFGTNMSSKDEKQVFEELKKEEDELKETEEYVQENFMNFDQSEVINKVSNYLSIRPGNDTTLRSELSFSMTGTLNNMKDTSLESNQISLQLQVDEKGTFVSPGKVETQSAVSLLNQLEEQNINKNSEPPLPLVNRTSKKLFTFLEQRKVEDSPIEGAQKVQQSDNKTQLNKDDPENSTPVFKLSSHQVMETKHAAKNSNDPPKSILEVDKSGSQLTGQFSSRILEELENETRENNILANRPLARHSSPSRILKPELAKDLANIGKSIEDSQKRSRSTKSSPTNRVPTSASSGSLRRNSSYMSDSNIRSRSPIYDIHLNLAKEIRELKATTLTLRQENTQLKKELIQIKSAINLDKSSRSIFAGGDSMQNVLLSTPRSVVTMPRTSNSESAKLKKEGPGHMRFNSYGSDPLSNSGCPVFVDSPQPVEVSAHQRQKSHTYSNAKSMSLKPSPTTEPRYNPSWASPGNSANSATKTLSKKLVVKDVMADMSFNTSTKSEIKSTRLTLLNTERETVNGKSLGFIFPDRNSERKCESAEKTPNSARELQSPILQSISKSRMKPITEVTKKRTTNSKASDSCQSFKVGEHPLFRKLSNRFDTHRAMRIFKLASLRFDGQIFENDILDVSMNTIRIEDVSGKRRLVRVNLIFGNKSDLYIQNFSISIRAPSALILVRDLELSKKYIKPNRKREVEFVVVVAETVFFSHLEIDCKCEQVDLINEGNPTLETQLLVPITYYNFMESLSKVEDEDISLAWATKSELALHSSGRFRLNEEIVKNKIDLMGIFPNVKSVKDPSINSLAISEPREYYSSVYETEKLGEFIHLRFDWFPDSQEIIIQTASASEIESKGVFIIQTLMFLLG